MNPSILVPKELCDAANEALETLTELTGLDVDALFGTRIIDNFDTLPGRAAYAGGFIEGAALVCGLTVIEFLDLIADAHHGVDRSRGA